MTGPDARSASASGQVALAAAGDGGRIRRDSGALSAESLTGLAAAAPEPDAERRRRITYLMLFRVVLMTLVLGATSVLYWLADVDLAAPGSIALFVIIAATFLATIVYAALLQRGVASGRLASAQLIVDLAIGIVLIHVTGGAQSAYTFFLPLTIIGAATVTSRNGTLAVAACAAALFTTVAVLGWAGALAPLEGQRIQPYDLTSIELGRALGLNLAGMIGVSVLALNLASQLQVASATLASQQIAAADLISLHGDIVRCLSSGLVTADPRGVVLTINEIACEIVRRSPAQAIGAPLEAILPGIDALTGTLGTDGTLQRAELDVRHARGDGAGADPAGGRSSRRADGAGDTVLGVSVSPLKSATGDFIGRVVNFQDLTELRKMEQNVKRAERLAVVGGMAAGVAHEIRNPLASISGSVELLRGMPQADEDSRALMEIVTREIDRLNGLLTELLDYTNPRPPKMTRFDLAQLVRDTIQVSAQDRVLGKIDFAFDEPPGERAVPIAADAAKLRQVLWNLLRNAAEAAGRGGGHVRVTLARGADAVELIVGDDGPGVAPEDRERIFDPFFTTKTKGHGLGLAIVQSLVAEHRGTVVVGADPSGGARFAVRLPYTQDDVG